MAETEGNGTVHALFVLDGSDFGGQEPFDAWWGKREGDERGGGDKRDGRERREVIEISEVRERESRGEEGEGDIYKREMEDEIMRKQNNYYYNTTLTCPNTHILSSISESYVLLKTIKL